MQIGIDSFAAAISDPATGLTLSPVERMHHLLEEIELADRVGLGGNSTCSLILRFMKSRVGSDLFFGKVRQHPGIAALQRRPEGKIAPVRRRAERQDIIGPCEQPLRCASDIHVQESGALR